MALSSRLRLVHRAINANGELLFEFAKEILDAGRVMASENHMLTLPPCNADGSALDWNYIHAQLDANTTALGFGILSDAEWQLVVDFAGAVLTPQVVDTARAALQDMVVPAFDPIVTAKVAP